MNLTNNRFFWPAHQTDDNNDAAIMEKIRELKAFNVEHGENEDMALANALGSVGSWELNEFKEGLVAREGHAYLFAGR